MLHGACVVEHRIVRALAVVSDLSSFMGLSAFLWVGWFHEREFGDEPIDDDAGLPVA